MRCSLTMVRSAALAVVLTAGGCVVERSSPPVVVAPAPVVVAPAPAPAAVVAVTPGQPVAAVPDAAAYDDGNPTANVGAFYTDLAPLGRWIYVADYGQVWMPLGVPTGWRPYTVGYWAWTDYGWTWVSEEPWGWATYHYGRWVILPGQGWVWMPGTVWAPAWVTWRSGGGFVGWAPLPPRVGFRGGAAITRIDVEIAPVSFSFVAERAFVEPRVHRAIVPVEQNVTIIRQTTNITNITVVENHVVNHGIEPARIERSTGRRIEQVHMREVSRAADAHQVHGNELAVYRPHIAPAAPAPAPSVKPTPTPAPRPAAAPPAVRPTPAPAPTVRPAPKPEPAAQPAPAPVPTVRRVPAATPPAQPTPAPIVRPAPKSEPAAQPAPAPVPTVRRVPAATPPAQPTPAATPTVRPGANAPAPAVGPRPAAAEGAKGASPKPVVAPTSAPAVRRAEPAPAVRPAPVRGPTSRPAAVPNTPEAPRPIR